MKTSFVTAALPVLAVTLLVSCGDRTDAPTDDARAGDAVPTRAPVDVPVPDGEVTTTYPVTVLDDGDGDGAELCLGGVAESYPPQCGGPALVGWDWAEHEGAYDEASGVRWGEFVVTGTFDGTDLTPSAVVAAADHRAPGTGSSSEDPTFRTTCPEPAGGWVVDPARASEADADRAFGVAERLDAYASSFVDTSQDPRPAGERDQDAAAGDAPAVSPWIVNVAVTEDAAAAEAAIRQVWGGGLCVTEASYGADELQRIADEVIDAVPGFLSGGAGDDRVEVGVVHDDGSIQAWADQEYGEGVVAVWSALQPV